MEISKDCVSVDKASELKNKKVRLFNSLDQKTMYALICSSLNEFQFLTLKVTVTSASAEKSCQARSTYIT